ncbi:MAG: DUF2259 domain-containing protein [Treponema sp.]|nr:DUF2259 domain-containing protein [Treponema sp.]
MKKLLTLGFLLLTSAFASFAGDSAVLVDNGFSADGEYYIFGQYGRTDKKYQAWAEFFTVDIAKNDYVDDEFFRVKPSFASAKKTGKEVYEELMGKCSDILNKYSCKPCKPEQILYIREEESKSGTDEIVFKDFSSSVSDDQAMYHITLLPTVSGSGENVKSSFVINVEKQDEKGNVLARQQVGSPSITRKGVKAYKIERIVCDESGKNMVFIIEKTMEDKTGINIRFMIEAASLNNDFIQNLASSESNS